METVCQEEGKRYLLCQDFQLSRSGIPVEQIRPVLRFPTHLRSKAPTPCNDFLILSPCTRRPFPRSAGKGAALCAGITGHRRGDGVSLFPQRPTGEKGRGPWTPSPIAN